MDASACWGAEPHPVLATVYWTRNRTHPQDGARVCIMRAVSTMSVRALLSLGGEERAEYIRRQLTQPVDDDADDDDDDAASDAGADAGDPTPYLFALDRAHVPEQTPWIQYIYLLDYAPDLIYTDTVAHRLSAKQVAERTRQRSTSLTLARNRQDRFVERQVRILRPTRVQLCGVRKVAATPSAITLKTALRRIGYSYGDTLRLFKHYRASTPGAPRAPRVTKHGTSAKRLRVHADDAAALKSVAPTSAAHIVQRLLGRGQPSMIGAVRRMVAPLEYQHPYHYALMTFYPRWLLTSLSPHELKFVFTLVSERPWLMCYIDAIVPLVTSAHIASSMQLWKRRALRWSLAQFERHFVPLWHFLPRFAAKSQRWSYRSGWTRRTGQMAECFLYGDARERELVLTTPKLFYGQYVAGHRAVDAAMWARCFELEVQRLYPVDEEEEEEGGKRRHTRTLTPLEKIETLRTLRRMAALVWDTYVSLSDRLAQRAPIRVSLRQLRTALEIDAAEFTDAHVEALLMCAECPVLAWGTPTADDDERTVLPLHVNGREMELATLLSSLTLVGHCTLELYHTRGLSYGAHFYRTLFADGGALGASRARALFVSHDATTRARLAEQGGVGAILPARLADLLAGTDTIAVARDWDTLVIDAAHLFTLDEWCRFFVDVLDRARRWLSLKRLVLVGNRHYMSETPFVVLCRLWGGALPVLATPCVQAANVTPHTLHAYTRTELACTRDVARTQATLDRWCDDATGADLDAVVTYAPGREWAVVAQQCRAHHCRLDAAHVYVFVSTRTQRAAMLATCGVGDDWHMREGDWVRDVDTGVVCRIAVFYDRCTDERLGDTVNMRAADALYELDSDPIDDHRECCGHGRVLRRVGRHCIEHARVLCARDHLALRDARPLVVFFATPHRRAAGTSVDELHAAAQYATEQFVVAATDTLDVRAVLRHRRPRLDTDLYHKLATYVGRDVLFANP